MKNNKLNNLINKLNNTQTNRNASEDVKLFSGALAEKNTQTNRNASEDVKLFSGALAEKNTQTKCEGVKLFSREKEKDKEKDKENTNIKELLVSYDYEGLYSFTYPDDADTISLIILNNFDNPILNNYHFISDNSDVASIDQHFSILQPCSNFYLLPFFLKQNHNPDKKYLKILDGTGGLGGNTISFCKYFLNVYSFEINKERFKMLKNNIEHLNLNNIYLSNEDSVEYMLNNHEKFDIYFFDPPWGGPDYKKIKSLSFKMGNYNLWELVNILIKKTNNKLLIFKLPFNYNLNEFNLFNYKLYKVHNYFIIIILL